MFQLSAVSADTWDEEGEVTRELNMDLDRRLPANCCRLEHSCKADAHTECKLDEWHQYNGELSSLKLCPHAT